MVKIIRIIGVVMFLLTVSSNVWARQIEDGGGRISTPTVVRTPSIPPPPPPTPIPTVTAPRTTPRRADYYYHDDYYARHPLQTPTSNLKKYIIIRANPTPALKAEVKYFTLPAPRPFVGSAAMSITITCNGGPCPSPTPTSTPSPTPTQAPANNIGRHIPK